MENKNQDYEDLGRSIAGAILEAGKTRPWALALIKPLGYGLADLEEWLKTYKRERYGSMYKHRQKVARRRRKIERLKQEAERLLRNG